MGIFSVIQKDRYHHSNIYSDAPMPYMQRITWSGVAMHEGVLPGHPASHGCIRLPHDFALRLWGMTKMGVRVVVTPRNSVAPVEFDHPRLVALSTKPVVPDVAAAPLGEGIEASGNLSPPALKDAAIDQRPGDLRPALMALADPPPSAPVPPSAAPPERPLKPGPVSVFVSRKLGRLYVRKGNEPIFDMPVTIAHPEAALGTYLFTVGQPTGDGLKLRWLAMSIASGRADVNPPRKSEGGSGKSRGSREAKSASAPVMSPTSAAEALDRIEFPPEALERISPLVTPGASLIVSDQGISGETGKDTDFIVLVR
jgi:hypothetical protein